MNWKKEGKFLVLFCSVFALVYYMPVENERLTNSIKEALALTQWYAREHVLLCLIPAFFIAGAIAVFISQASVMKYLGAGAKKVIAYGVASVSGSILAVCSCTVLPLFAGIYRMGAGLGPATAFLYAGPAINVLAIILTARVLGPQMGIARAVGAVVFSIIIGLLMHNIFRKEDIATSTKPVHLPDENKERSLWQNGLYFASMVGILVFANWGKPGETGGIWAEIYSWKWIVTAGFALVLAFVLYQWFTIRLWKLVSAVIVVWLVALVFPQWPELAFLGGVLGLSMIAATEEGESTEWVEATWGFAKQILPLLLIGVLIAGALLGRAGQEGLIPSQWIAQAVGGNSIQANFFASFAGAFMYFATLTEVPILEGLIGNGMGPGPALALLLAGPALSLPNMLVIRSVLGTRKTVVFVCLVIIMATISGLIYGILPIHG